MPIKCYNKPNRKQPRFFTACDAARIAQQVVDDRGLTPEQVLACIAKNLGFTHISLSRQAVVEGSLVPLGGILVRLSIASLGQLLRLLRQLKDFITSKEGLLILAKGLDLLSKTIDLINKQFIVPESVPVDDVVEDRFCRCKKSRGKNEQHSKEA